MRDFFDALFADGTGYVEIVTDQFQTERWFEWPRDANTIVKYCELRVDEDVYVSTTLFSDKRRITENATEGKVIYADADTCTPDKFRLKPSISVQTRPGRWHCYWMLDQMHTAAEVSEVSHKVAAAHKDQGCDGGWIPTKLLRVPGTVNTKDAVPYRIEAFYSGYLYSMEDFEEAYADVSLERVEVVSDALSEALPSLLDALGKMPDDLWDLYAEEVPQGGSWSERMWKLQLDLFRAGLTKEEVFVIARKAKCNKYGEESEGKTTQTGLPIPRRTDPDGVLWKEVLKASQVYTSDVSTDIVISEPIREVVVDGESSYVFLSDEERQWVNDHPNFIDEFTAWVGTRSPQSAEVYRRSLAYMLLSCVYGPKALIRFQFAKVFLNLWVFLLGETTATKKTTVVRLMFEVLKEWEERIQDKIYVGDDFTAEGLNKALAERSGKVSLLRRDEVDGLFRELLTKNYLSGTAETMTSLYDGEIRVSLRATAGAGQTSRSETIFNFLGYGTDKGVSEVLTVKQFHTGFMIRPVWAVADAPEWQAENEYLQIAEEDDAAYQELDPQVALFCNQFWVAQRAIEKLGKPARMKITPEAQDRLNQWQKESHDAIDGNRNQEYIDPSRQRLAISMMKSAALLAVHDGTNLIDMGHVLHVIAQGELWFRDMIRTVNSVAASDFEGKVNAVEQFVAKSADGRVQLPKVYARFAGYTVGQVDEFIKSLEQQARIKRVRVDDKVFLEIRQ